MPKKTTVKNARVYCVKTAILTDEDASNWASYNVIANDAESAIQAAKPKFRNENEFAESVELLVIIS